MRTLARVAITLVSPWMFSSAVNAQMLAPVAARYDASVPLDTVSQTAFGRSNHFSVDAPVRITIGLMGSIGGAYMGGMIGAHTASGCHGEFCAVGNALTGAAIGSVIGSAILSSVPTLENPCGGAQRFVTGLAGSFVGALGGGVAGLLMGPLGVAVGYIGGSAVGGGLGAGVCH